MVNFQRDDVLGKLLEEIHDGEYRDFDFLDAGASKAVFKFREETYKETFVIKVEINTLSDWEIEQINDRAIETGKSQISYYSTEEYGEACWDNQVKKECALYKFLKEADSSLSKYLMPILLEYSDPEEGYIIQPFSDSLVTAHYLSNKMESIIVDKDYESYICYPRRLANYFSGEEQNEHSGEIVCMIEDLIKIKKWIGVDLTQDMRLSNVRKYNERIVFIDYGYYENDVLEEFN